MPTDEKVRHLEQFVLNLKKLVRDLVAKYPADDRIGRLRKRIGLATDLGVLGCQIIADAVGPYLYKYRELIYSESCDVFSGLEIGAGGFESEEIIQLVNYIITKIDECAVTPDERQKYQQRLISLLESYVDYQCTSYS